MFVKLFYQEKEDENGGSRRETDLLNPDRTGYGTCAFEPILAQYNDETPREGTRGRIATSTAPPPSNNSLHTGSLTNSSPLHPMDEHLHVSPPVSSSFSSTSVTTPVLVPTGRVLVSSTQTDDRFELPPLYKEDE